MTTTPTAEEQAALAENQALAKRIRRRMRTNLALLAASCLLGLTLLLATDSPWASMPCFIVAGVFVFMYLESRDHHAEVCSRRWKRLAPKASLVVKPAATQAREPLRMAG